MVVGEKCMKWVCQLGNGYMLGETDECLIRRNVGYPYPDTEESQEELLCKLLIRLNLIGSKRDFHGRYSEFVDKFNGMFGMRDIIDKHDVAQTHKLVAFRGDGYIVYQMDNSVLRVIHDEKYIVSKSDPVFLVLSPDDDRGLKEYNLFIRKPTKKVLDAGWDFGYECEGFRHPILLGRGYKGLWYERLRALLKFKVLLPLADEAWAKLAKDLYPLVMPELQGKPSRELLGSRGVLDDILLKELDARVCEKLNMRHILAATGEDGVLQVSFGNIDLYRLLGRDYVRFPLQPQYLKHPLWKAGNVKVSGSKLVLYLREYIGELGVSLLPHMLRWNWGKLHGMFYAKPIIFRYLDVGVCAKLELLGDPSGNGWDIQYRLLEGLNLSDRLKVLLAGELVSSSGGIGLHLLKGYKRQVLSKMDWDRFLKDEGEMAWVVLMCLAVLQGRVAVYQFDYCNHGLFVEVMDFGVVLWMEGVFR